MKNNKWHIVFMLCVTVLSIGRSCRGMTVTESSIEARNSRSPLGQVISSLNMYNITRQMPVNFQKLTENFTQVPFFRIESIDEVDVQNVIHHLAETTNRILLEYDGYGDIWVGGVKKIAEIFVKACDMADQNNKNVIIFFSHTDFLIDWRAATELDNGKMLSAFHKILDKYKERQDVRLIIHTKLLDGHVVRPWWSDVERIKLELPDACERKNLVVSAFAKEGISVERTMLDRIVEHSDGWTWTRVLLRTQEGTLNIKRYMTGKIMLKSRESTWMKSMRQCKNMLYPIHKFFKQVSVEDIAPVVITMTIAGGCIALIVHLHRIEQEKSEKIKNKPDSLKEELDQQQTASCIL